MKTGQKQQEQDIELVIGDWERNHVIWIDPVTGLEKWAQGDFQVIDGKYVHQVYDEDGNLLYIVTE